MNGSDNVPRIEERHYTINELAAMWNFSVEFVRQLVQHEPGVTEWVRQRPGRRRYRVIRVPQSVAERLYRRALERGDLDSLEGLNAGRDRIRGHERTQRYDRVPCHVRATSCSSFS